MDGIQATSGTQTAAAAHASARAHGHHGHRKAEMLKKFDTNNDGKIDDSERKAALQQMRAKFGDRHDGPAGEDGVAKSNREAVQSATAGQYGSDGQAPAQGQQPTVDLTA
jgi:hypothetical protein